MMQTISCIIGKKKWKKTCCLPSFVIFLFILGCVIAGITLLAIFRVDPEHLTVNAVLISIASIVGMALVLNCRTWWQVLDSLLNSQRKRLHNAASKLHKLKSEGFMKVSFCWLSESYYNVICYYGMVFLAGNGEYFVMETAFLSFIPYFSCGKLNFEVKKIIALIFFSKINF